MSQYRGRFAPSPTGPLHLGSLVAALGSFLDARSHRGKWLLRIEDVDTPRIVQGAADEILRTLEAYGLHWDDAVIYQSKRGSAYQESFLQLQKSGLVYPCSCSRKEIADTAVRSGEELIYPGTCRAGLPAGKAARAWRIRTDLNTRIPPGEGTRADFPANNGYIDFHDLLQGHIKQHLEYEIGDFVVLRADGPFAYQLAVVVDDAAQDISHIVRGADLLCSTTRQIYLQRILGLPSPAYMHLPVIVNDRGEKLSKQTLAEPVDNRAAAATMFTALRLMRQQPPAELGNAPAEQLLSWAIANWKPQSLLNCAHICAA
ncbi:MAG: tRNA glutamyl-Q(34) synthetase GluQRS [Gallionella sp.]